MDLLVPRRFVAVAVMAASLQVVAGSAAHAHGLCWDTITIAPTNTSSVSAVFSGVPSFTASYNQDESTYPWNWNLTMSEWSDATGDEVILRAALPPDEVRLTSGWFNRGRTCTSAPEPCFGYITIAPTIVKPSQSVYGIFGLSASYTAVYSQRNFAPNTPNEFWNTFMYQTSVSVVIGAKNKKVITQTTEGNMVRGRYC